MQPLKPTQKKVQLVSAQAARLEEAGSQWACKGGQGVAVASDGAVQVGAIMGVNALGSVFADNGHPRWLSSTRFNTEIPGYLSRFAFHHLYGEYGYRLHRD